MPRIALLARRLEAGCRGGGTAEIQQKAGRGRVRVMEDEIALGRNGLAEDRRAFAVDEAGAGVEPGLRVRRYRRCRCGGGARYTKRNKLATFHCREITIKRWRL